MRPAAEWRGGKRAHSPGPSRPGRSAEGPRLKTQRGKRGGPKHRGHTGGGSRGGRWDDGPSARAADGGSGLGGGGGPRSSDAGATGGSAHGGGGGPRAQTTPEAPRAPTVYGPPNLPRAGPWAPAPLGSCAPCAAVGAQHVPCVPMAGKPTHHLAGYRRADGAYRYVRCQDLEDAAAAAAASGLPAPAGYGHGRTGPHCRRRRKVGPAGPLPGSCRPIEWYQDGEPCPKCAGTIVGHGTFCVDCTVEGPDIVLAPGVRVCERDQCLFRIACKNMHHLECGGYKGAPPSQSRPVDPSRDASIIVKAVGQIATAHVRRALRPLNKRLARAT